MSDWEPIDDPKDTRIAQSYRNLRYWEQGFSIAKRWYHEEWDGSSIQLDLARDIAEGIEKETSNYGG